MDIEKTKTKIKCDVSGCNNLSDYRLIFSQKYTKKMRFCKIINYFYICKNCLNDLYNLISPHIIPKSPQPIFKNKGVKNDKTI